MTAKVSKMQAAAESKAHVENVEAIIAREQISLTSILEVEIGKMHETPADRQLLRLIRLLAEKWTTRSDQSRLLCSQRATAGGRYNPRHRS